MDTKALLEIAKKMVAPGKGLLAADESSSTANKRLASIKMEGNEENRRKYRVLFLDIHGIEEFLSGVILYDETIRQKASNGTSFPELLIQKGIIPGIKVDTGAKDFALHIGEKITEGLDNLGERLKEYYAIGARFAKWRAVITIDDANGLPSDVCIKSNAHAMARYAAICQENGMVPIVEPEVLLDGTHTIEKCEEVSEKTLKMTFAELKEMGVYLPGVILKTSMVLSGNKCQKKSNSAEIATATLRCLKKSVPKEVTGIVFLSGGQTADEATENLNAIVALAKKEGSHSPDSGSRLLDSGTSLELGASPKLGAPWQLSFSYARALQGPSLEVWQGREENMNLARNVFLKRLKMTSAAREGNYSSSNRKDIAKSRNSWPKTRHYDKSHAR